MKVSFAAVFILAAFIGSVLSKSPHISSMFLGMMQQERSAMKEPCDDNSEKQIFDFIIVGAGAAGCVLANRLTEVEHWDVLLLEAGGEETEIMNIPYLPSQFDNTDVDWKYVSEPSETLYQGLKLGRIYYPSGKVMGGSTMLNFMLYVRGNDQDYNNWESMGNPGWNYSDVLPYFKKAENMEISEYENSIYHSTTGNIKINFPPYQSKISSIILEAGRELGEDVLDYNGQYQKGFSRLQTTTSNGSRWGASRGYLHPIRDRKNLYVRKRSLVSNIIINPITKTADGVQYTKEGKTYRVFARKEVIISAGSYKSPQILMLSGIGPKTHLQNLNISVLADLPVGNNFMDHINFGGIIFLLNESKCLSPSEILYNLDSYLQYYANHTGPLTTAGVHETVSFLELNNTSYYSPGQPNIEVLYASRTTITDKAYLKSPALNDEIYKEYIMPIMGNVSFQILAILLRPRSRGTVRLRDKNIETQPIIDPQIFTEEEDLNEFVAGIKTIIDKLIQTKALQKIGIKLYNKPLPPCSNITFGSDEYWKCAVRAIPSTICHGSGTCKMGPKSDNSSVVDATLKVHGIHHLRVTDASVMPMIPSGHTGATVYMIAEKIADAIKNDHM